MRVGWVSAVQDRRIASFRYRVEAPAAGLRARGHHVDVIHHSQADNYDVAVFSKAYSAEHRAQAEAVKRRGGRVIFDICDNHFYNPFDLPKYRKIRKNIDEMISISDRVICSTPALATVVREEVKLPTQPLIVGDIVERLKPRKRPARPAAPDSPLRLTWFGSHGSPNAPSGMTDLLLIREELEALAARHPVELTVCSNNRAKFDQEIAPLNLPSRYVEWSLDGFAEVLADADAAILPMNVNPFTACKTHNRLTTALYAGVPAVASGIESYRDFEPFCTLDDWNGGFETLVQSHEQERLRALSSREHIDRRWTIDTLALQWEAALALPARQSEATRLRAVRLHGRLDAVARGAVTGWVRPAADHDVQVQVVLEYDGEPVSIGVADRPREDLKHAGLPSDCGFSLPLPARLIGPASPRLTVRVLDSGWIVGENPIVIAGDESPSFAPTAGGHAPAPRSVAPQAEQRWEVGGAVASQERALTDLQNQKTAAALARAAASRRALGDTASPEASPRWAGAFRKVIESGADTVL